MRGLGTLARRLVLVVPLAGLLVGLGCRPGQTVKFGIVLPLTGSMSDYGQSIKSGVELAFETVEQDSDIPYEVEIEIVDSKGDPDTAARLAGDLYGAGALAIIGGVTNAEALAMVEVSKQQQKVLLSPTASSDQLSEAGRTFYRIFPNTLKEASGMANFASEGLKIHDLVVLIEGSPFAEATGEGIANAFRQYEGEVKETLFFPTETSDWGEILDQALALKPSGIYIAANGPQTASLIAALRDRRYGLGENNPGRIMATSSFAHPAVIAQAGSKADGVYMTMTVFDIGSEEGRMPAFVGSFRETNGADPDFFAAHGYDAMLVIGEALKYSASTLSSDFLKGMRAMEPLAGVTGNLQFDEDGDAQKFPRIHTVRGGVIVDYQKWQQKKREEFLEKQREIREKLRKLQEQADGLR